VHQASEVVAAAAAPAGGDDGRDSEGEAAARTLVATGGCFDLLHPGHVSTLERARRLGDRLVVLLNSDASVRRLKGPGRPVQDEQDRAAVLRSLACVDDVVVFDEDTPAEALRRLRPDVFVKGGDYSSAELPEAAVLAEWGGTVLTVPFVDGRSTTGLLQRIDGKGMSHVG
jgi:rfaE bifunctional protein nucleotidyltransferase chain/domain